jgi:hypothetical protein
MLAITLLIIASTAAASPTGVAVLVDGSAAVPAALPFSQPNVGGSAVAPVAPTYASTAQGVNLNGFFKPTSVTWDDVRGRAARAHTSKTNCARACATPSLTTRATPQRGNVYVGLKVGQILVFDSWIASASSATTVIDISATVSSFGDHGLTSILHECVA